MESRKLPAGIENFEEIRTEGFYYVDTTGLIRDLLNNWGKVNLFTRLRRFGKTLNMSMLKSFLRSVRTERCLTVWRSPGNRRCAKRTWASFR